MDDFGGLREAKQDLADFVTNNTFWNDRSTKNQSCQARLTERLQRGYCKFTDWDEGSSTQD